MKTLTAIFLIFIFTALAEDAFGATKISARGGGFGLASTWTDNLPPANGDDIIIQSGHGVHGTSGRVVNNLTVHGTLTLSHPGITVNGTLHVAPGAIIYNLSGLLYLNGDVVNDGAINPSSEINGEGNQSISGSGIWNGNGGEFNGSGTKTLSNVRMINGWWAVNSRVNVAGRWLMTKGRINKTVTGIVEGAGVVEFQDVGHFASNESTGNLWTVPIEITTGTRSAVGSSSISAPVTVRSGTWLSTSLNITLNLKDDVFIETNAKLSGQTVQLSGVNISNNGEVFPTVLEFKRDGDQAISGGGTWRNSNGIYFRGSGTKSLLNDMTTSVSTVAVESTLNINEHILTVKNGNFNKPVTGSIIGTGKVSFEGNGNFYSHETGGNLFAVPVEIKTGTRSANSTSSFSAPVTVRSGATLSTHLRIKLHMKDDLTLEAGGVISGESLELYDSDFSNNGSVATVWSYFRGSTVLSGTTGSFGGNGTYVEPGASVSIVGIQQFRNLTVRSGGSLDISQNQIKVSGVLSPAGTMTTAGSTIEFNGIYADQMLPTNIDYYNLTINNTREVNLHAVETVQNVLRLERGVFDIYTNRLMMGNCGQIVYVNGALKGTPIYPNCTKIAFVGDTPRDNIQMPDVVHTLTVQNTQPVRLIKNLTATHALEIFSDLETGDFTLTMPAEAVSVGTADVVGTVRRTGILNETAYSFGNPHNAIRFDTGVAPTEVSVKLTKSAPADLTRAVSRTYHISPVGGVNYSATLRLRYDDAELNGNDESMLQFFHSNGTWLPVAASSRDETDNWLEATGVTSFSPWTMAEITEPPPPVEQTFTVTNLEDSGAGSLRQAVLDANANAGNDTINLQGLSGTITLTGELQISESVTITGAGAHLLTLSGGGLNRVFSISRSAYDNSPFVVKISDLTITEGFHSECGGGIFASGVELILNRLAVNQNAANSGGGLCFTGGGSLNITNSAFSGNNAGAGSGGAIRLENSAVLSLINSTVSDNEAAINGGGISVETGASASIVNSTVSHNSGGSGGGIYNSGATTLRNTIVAANIAQAYTNVAGVFSSLGHNLIGAAEINQGFTDGESGDKVGTIDNPIDPKLGELQENGGATGTRALLAQSPALEAGANCVLEATETGGCLESPLTVDQRGDGFTRRAGAQVDIGAYEAADGDGDGIPDVSDNCPTVSNPVQTDTDGDGAGDACDADDDGDNVSDETDNCPLTPNPNQTDTDGDGQGDACDGDDDNDGISDAADNCPLTDNPEQTDTDADGAGDVCDADDDGDGISDTADNCPLTLNPDQADFDLDGIGDACDAQTGPPRNKEQCKNDGWRRFDFPRAFRNQGDCIQFVNTGM